MPNAKELLDTICPIKPLVEAKKEKAEASAKAKAPTPKKSFVKKPSDKSKVESRAQSLLNSICEDDYSGKTDVNANSEGDALIEANSYFTRGIELLNEYEFPSGMNEAVKEIVLKISDLVAELHDVVPAPDETSEDELPVEEV